MDENDIRKFYLRELNRAALEDTIILVICLTVCIIGLIIGLFIFSWEEVKEFSKFMQIGVGLVYTGISYFVVTFIVKKINNFYWHIRVSKK